MGLGWQSGRFLPGRCQLTASGPLQACFLICKAKALTTVTQASENVVQGDGPGLGLGCTRLLHESPEEICPCGEMS